MVSKNVQAISTLVDDSCEATNAAFRNDQKN
jgi:hypothetical protein